MNELYFLWFASHKHKGHAPDLRCRKPAFRLGRSRSCGVRSPSKPEPTHELLKVNAWSASSPAAKCGMHFVLSPWSIGLALLCHMPSSERSFGRDPMSQRSLRCPNLSRIPTESVPLEKETAQNSTYCQFTSFWDARKG